MNNSSDHITTKNHRVHRQQKKEKQKNPKKRLKKGQSVIRFPRDV